MRHRVRFFDDPAETGARVVVGGLFLALTWRLAADFLETSRPTDLLLLVGESLVVVLTCLRRTATTVDRRVVVRLVTLASMLSPLMIRPGPIGSAAVESAATALIGLGLIVVIGGKLSLGYSFGLLPANRGVKNKGLYRLVRHPIYLGYLITHIAFVAAHPTVWNVVVLVAGDIALIVRAFYEEQTLSKDDDYVRYCQSVKWRLVPGQF